MSKTGWGTPKFGSGDFKRTGKPAKGPGNNYIRILPPMFTLADEGTWAVYRTTHWGYSGVSAKDPNRPVVRPFLCIEDKDFRTQIVRQSCPECDLYNRKAEEDKTARAALKTAGKTDDQIDEELAEEKKWLQAHAPERKWYLNVKYKDGTFGDYKINHKTHKKGIDNKIKELLAEQEIAALAPDQGVWFNIKRSGNGWDTPDTIEVEMEMIEPGKPSKGFRTLMAELTEDDWDRANKECRDLSTVGGQVLSFEQIRDLTKCSGDPGEVDDIMGARKSDKPKVVSKATDQADYEQEEPEEAPPVSREEVKRAVAEHKAEEKGLPASVADPELIAKRDAILAKRAKAAAEKAEAEAKAKAAAAPAAAAKAPLDMTEDEILSFFETNGGPAAKTA